MSASEEKFYISMDVWSRRDEKTLVRYRCFRVLPDDLYCVQSADFFRVPFSPKDLVNSDIQFLELLVEEKPEARCALYPSIREAIQQHLSEFGPP